MLPVHLFSSFASRCFIYYKGFISCHQWISAKLSVFFYKHYLLCTHRHNKFVTRMKPESLNLRLPLRVWAKLCSQTLLNRTRSLLIIDYFPIHWCSAVLQFQWLTSAFSSAPGADPTPNPERHSRPEQQTSRTGASAGFPAMQNKVSFKFTSEISVSVERDEGSGLIQSKPHFCLEHFTSTNERNTVKIHKTINGVHTGFGLDLSSQLRAILSLICSKHCQVSTERILHQALYKTILIWNATSRTWVICSHPTTLKLLTIISDQSFAGYSHSSRISAFTDYDSWKHSQTLTPPH